MNKKRYPPEYTELEINWLKEHNFEENEKKIYKKRKSISSSYLDNEDISLEIKKNNLSFDLNKLKSLGGDELVVLYLTGTNFELSSKELKISESSLRSKIYRLREKLEEQNISYQELFDSLY